MHDPTVPVGRLLFNVLAMVAEALHTPGDALHSLRVTAASVNELFRHDNG